MDDGTKGLGGSDGAANAEIAVLGAHLIEAELDPGLPEEAFGHRLNRAVYAAVRTLRERHVPVDVVSVADEMEAQGTAPDESLPHLSSLLDAVPTAAHVRHHEDTVRQAWVRRTMSVMLGAGESVSDMLKWVRDHGTPHREATEVLSWAEMQALPPLTWLIEDLLADSGVSILIGHPKAGKSTLSRVLAAEVAGYGSGRFLGRDVVTTGRVLYYSPDEAPQMTAQHFKSLLPPTATHIEFAQRGTMSGIARALNGHKLLVVDTLGRLFSDAKWHEGDSYFQWQRHLDVLRRLATDKGCHIALLHHARKSGGDRGLAVLGSAAIAGSCDTIVEVTVEDEDDAPVRYVRSVNRAGIELPKTKLVLGTNGWLTASVPPAQQADAIAEAQALRDDGLTVRQIAAQLGVGRGWVARHTNGGGA